MNCLCIQAREWLASQQFTPEQVKVVEMRWNAVNKYPDKAQTMRDAFERADFANDGSLSRAELVEMLRSDADVIALLKTPEPPVEFDSSFAGMGADETSVIAAEFVQHLLEVIGVNALDGIEFNVEGMESLDIEALRLELFPEAVAAAAAAAAAAQDEADGAEVKTWLDETVGEVEEIHAGVEALLSDVEEVAQAMDALLVAAVEHALARAAEEESAAAAAQEVAAAAAAEDAIAALDKIQASMAELLAAVEVKAEEDAKADADAAALAAEVAAAAVARHDLVRTKTAEGDKCMAEEKWAHAAEHYAGAMELPDNVEVCPELPELKAKVSMNSNLFSMKSISVGLLWA